MKLYNISFIICILFSLLITINWAAPETTKRKTEKPTENFYGSIIKHDGAEFNAQYITIKGKTSKIPLYDMPRNLDPAAKNPDTDMKEVDLKKRPKGYSERNLRKIAEIRVQQEPVFVYAETERREKRYVQMTIISNNKRKTQNQYLISIDEQLECDQEDGENLIRRVVPITEISHIIIRGKKLS